MVQSVHGNNAVEYRVMGESGPAHWRSFDVEVTVNGERMGMGAGLSKKAAEVQAAKEAVDAWLDR